MLHRGEKSWEAKLETLSQATAGSHYLPPLDWRDKERWLCPQNTRCGPPGGDWDKPVRKELGPQSRSSCCWRHCQRWKGKSSHMLAFPLFLFSNPLPVPPSCPNQARSQRIWSLGIIAASQLLVTHNKQGQSKENNLWATDSGPIRASNSLNMFKIELFISLTPQPYAQKPLHSPLFPTSTIATNNYPGQKLEYHPWLLSHPHSDSHQVVWPLSTLPSSGHHHLWHQWPHQPLNWSPAARLASCSPFNSFCPE